MDSSRIMSSPVFLGIAKGPGSTEPSRHSCGNWLQFFPAEGKQVQRPHRRGDASGPPVNGVLGRWSLVDSYGQVF